MLTEERHGKILNILEKQNAATVIELAKSLDTSESTIRRDLVSLDRMGKLKKVHGGATSVNEPLSITEPDVYTKELMNIREKQEIGRVAAGFIQNSDFVFIDAGTTTEAMIDFIPDNVRATFVTNGIVHAKKLIQKGLKAYIIGGQIKLTTEAVIGTESLNNLKKFNFTKAFVGVNGVDLQVGFTTPDPEEALIKEEAVNRAFITYVLADKSKFGKTSAVTFAELNKACIITDELENNEFREYTVVKEANL